MSKKDFVFAWVNKNRHRIDETTGNIIKVAGGVRKTSKDKWGYLSMLCYSGGKKYNVFVHHLVWYKINGAIPDGLTIDHINRTPTDNRIVNLRLATSSEQIQNASRTKITIDKAIEIYKSNKSTLELAEMFKTTRQHIRSIRHKYKKRFREVGDV